MSITTVVILESGQRIKIRSTTHDHSCNMLRALFSSKDLPKVVLIKRTPRMVGNPLLSHYRVP